jgi:hypothetical protein
VPAIPLEIINSRLVDYQFAADPVKMLHPFGEFNSLVNRLPWFVELVCPLQRRRGPVGRGKVEPSAIHVRAIVLPEVYAKVAFRLKGVVEHALGGRNPAVSNVVRRAVGNDADIEIFLAQADPKLQASLTAADNCNPHFASLRDTTLRSRTGTRWLLK